jgi:hypothetical protein
MEEMEEMGVRRMRKSVRGRRRRIRGKLLWRPWHNDGSR